MRRLRQPELRRCTLYAINPNNNSKTDRERMLNLQEMVKTADEAESIEKFADSLVDDEEEHVLKELVRPGVDLEALSFEYKAVLKFRNKIHNTVQIGKFKERTIIEIKAKIKEDKK